jgi:quercetin dioxygenase-like cupin family protein
MHTAFERPFRPTELPPTTLEGFDLRALADQLILEEPFTQHSRNALTLVRSNALTIVLTVVKAGTTVREHSSSGPTSVIGITGSCTLVAEEAQTEVHLTAGTIAAFAEDVVHHVEAHSDSAFLIVIGTKS